MVVEAAFPVMASEPHDPLTVRYLLFSGFLSYSFRASLVCHTTRLLQAHYLVMMQILDFFRGPRGYFYVYTRAAQLA